MELKFLGRDSGFGENNNSAYYEENNKLVLIDCGFTVFNIAKKTFDFNKYEKVEIIITHLHNDHAGSLSQLILYLWFIFNKKTTVISNCENIKKYLEITGTPEDAYTLINSRENLEFIKTTHVAHLDSYSAKLKINNKSILYTGDTSTIEPYFPHFSNINELYIDVSTTGGVHLNIKNILPKLEELKNNGTDIFLMHLDNPETIKNITDNKFYM